MNGAVMVDVVLTLKDKLAMVAIYLVLYALFVVVFSDGFQIRQTLRAELTVMMTELVRMVGCIGYGL